MLTAPSSRGLALALLTRAYLVDFVDETDATIWGYEAETDAEPCSGLSEPSSSPSPDSSPTGQSEPQNPESTLSSAPLGRRWTLQHPTEVLLLAHFTKELSCFVSAHHRPQTRTTPN